MKSKYFANCNDIGSLKKEYRRLAKIYHTDNGNSGSDKIMGEINAEYDTLFNAFKSFHNSKPGNEANQNTEEPEVFRDIINQLLKLDGLIIEVCGNWLWIGGDSYKHRETLRSLNFKYAPKKKLWYLGAINGKRKKSMSMEHIRNKYGSDVYNSEKVLRLAY